MTWLQHTAGSHPQQMSQTAELLLNRSEIFSNLKLWLELSIYNDIAHEEHLK